MTVSGGHAIAAPLPGRLRAHGPAYFVDREDQQAALHKALADVADGRERRAAFILGEPGIGKTRLVSEIGQRAHETGVLVLAGRCDEGLDLAYQPFVEAIEHLIEFAPGQLLEDHVAVYGDSIGRLVPTLRRRVSALAPAPPPSEGERYLLYAAIEGLLATAAGDQALLLVLEDLHWADVPTLLVLRRLLTSPRSAPILILGTARAGDLSDEHPLRQLLADLHREPGVVRLELDGLGSDDIVALLRGISDNPLDAAEQRLGETLKRTTDGNPFYITELVRNLAEAGQVVKNAGRWSPAGSPDGELELPASISETLARRIARLGPTASLCLTAAAVIGFEFDGALVSTVTESDSVTAMLDRAVASGLLVEVRGVPGRLRFAHALVQRHLYSELGNAMRVELHRLIATALERRLGGGGVRIADLARHWLAAARAPDLEKPIRYAVLAGDEALQSLAPDEAARWYSVALELTAQLPDPSEQERCQLLIRRGEAERQAGRPAFRDTLLEAARLAQANGDEEALVRAALANTRGLTGASGEIDEERVAVCEAALATLEESDSAERALLLAIVAAEFPFSSRPHARRFELSDEALAIARSLGDPDTLGVVLNMRFLTIWVPSTHPERLANTADAVRVAEASGDLLAQYFAYHWRTSACIEGGEVKEARRCSVRESELADRVRYPTALWLSRCAEANFAMLDGRLADAEQLANAAFAAGQESEPDALPCYTTQLSYILAEQGRLGDVVPMIEQTVADNPGIPGFRAVLARAVADAGRIDEARAIVAIDAQSDFGELAHDATWLSVACIYAEVAARIADSGAAATLYQLLQPWSGLVAYTGFDPWGPVSIYLGDLALVLGDLDAAEPLFEQGAAVATEAHAPIWSARAVLGRARMLRLRGAHAEARALLDELRPSVESLGAGAVLREIEALDDGSLAR